MIKLCKDLQYLRCTKEKYIIKKGSMSNYSFDITDEKRTGILNVLFEELEYPIDETTFHKIVEKYLGDETDDFLQKLLDLEILQQMSDNIDKLSLMIITNTQNYDILSMKLRDMNYDIIGFYDIEMLSEDNIELENYIENCDVLLVFSNAFRPDLFYSLNNKIVKKGTKTLISYMDGDEGVILPLVNPQKLGCYNDYELIREASFHNLLEYQIMKEESIKKSIEGNFFFETSILADWTIMIMNSICDKSHIDYFAYSLDFERMHFTKSKLFKFPKCPSCQGDKNLTHPFI